MWRTLSSLGLVLMVGALAVPTEAVHASEDGKHTASSLADQPVPTPDEQIAFLDAKCAASAEARKARHQEKPLFERLGGEEKIHALTREIVRLHLENKSIQYIFTGLDTDKVAHRVALFIISGTGGQAAYDGPALSESHAHMKLSNADFLAAGADVIQAMKNLGYGQNEIDEMVCILVGLRDQVVFSAANEGGSSKR